MTYALLMPNSGDLSLCSVLKPLLSAYKNMGIHFPPFFFKGFPSIQFLRKQTSLSSSHIVYYGSVFYIPLKSFINPFTLLPADNKKKMGVKGRKKKKRGKPLIYIALYVKSIQLRKGNKKHHQKISYICF